MVGNFLASFRSVVFPQSFFEKSQGAQQVNTMIFVGECLNVLERSMSFPQSTSISRQCSLFKLTLLINFKGASLVG